MTTIHDLFDRVLAKVIESENTDDEKELLRKLTSALRVRDAAELRGGTRAGRDAGSTPGLSLPMLSCRSLREERRLTAFEEEIMYMSARRISLERMRAGLGEARGIDISGARISRITEEIRREIRRWRVRKLEKTYPVLYLDGVHLGERGNQGRDGIHIRYAVGVTPAGVKDILGIWSTRDNPENLLQLILCEFKSRGVESILVAFVPRVHGSREAFAHYFPLTSLHLSAAALARDSLASVACGLRKKLGRDMRNIFHADTLAEAESRILAMKDTWSRISPELMRIWKDSRKSFAEYFKYPPEIRRTFYQFYVLESLNSSLRKLCRKLKRITDDEDLDLIFFLTLHGVSKRWSISVRDWDLLIEGLVTHFKERRKDT
jgi:transposase-like protein